MKHTFIFLAAVAGLFFTGCNDPETETNWKTEAMKKFIVPDSINKSLVAVMYEEDAPARRSLLVYDDTNRTSARKITYFADQPATVEIIIPVESNEFRSKYAEYRIREKTVLTYYKGISNTCASYNWTSESGIHNVQENNLMAKN